MSLTPESAISLKIYIGGKQRSRGRSMVSDRLRGPRVLQEKTNVLHLLLLSLGEVEHLVGVLEEDSGLCLGLGDVETAGVDGNLHRGALLDDTWECIHA